MRTLEEDGVFIISRVIVVAAPKKFRTVNRDVSLTFFHETKFVRVDDTGVIPKYKFELQDFDTVGHLIGDVVSFIDVIGWVVNYGDIETTHKDGKRLNVELQNDRKQSITVSLWGDKGPEFMSELAKKTVPRFLWL
ncbi:uncharacterized protein LOC141716869 [Apium graveolens]|uniref:uncharacterized protein LOC141716869 n=1 Tax=Apium graveolens TaxID=4045 RepID=UPI003D793ED1